MRPDVARVAVGVITQDRTASDAATKNAEQAAAVIAALRSLLGATAEIQTISYSLTPVYTYPSGGQPQLTGFSANNIVEATVGDPGADRSGGRCSDSGGRQSRGKPADGTEGRRFRAAQALRLAGQRARVKAEAIAAGLGVRLGAVIAAHEGVSGPAGSVDRIGAALPPP